MRIETGSVSADGTVGSHTLRGWGVSLLLVVIGVAYLSSFWGRAATHFPEPFYSWAETVRQQADIRHRFIDNKPPYLWLGAQVVLAMVIPAGLLGLTRRWPTDVGIGWPNVLGRRLVLVSVIVSIPFGGWLLSTHPYVDLARTDRYFCNMLAMIPEHFLICGVFVAILLPGRRLPESVPIAPVEGHWPTRVLRWLGLAQPSAPDGDDRTLAWLGLTWTSLAAILASGMLFYMVHIGKDNPVEVGLSLIGGVAIAYVTLRSRSIWPAILAHWSMNLIPLGMLILFRYISGDS